MTEIQFKKKIKEMTKETAKKVEEESLKLFKCGGIDTKRYENNYLLPKICLYVALQNTAWQYKPLQADHLRKAKNLLKF